MFMLGDPFTAALLILALPFDLTALSLPEAVI